MVFLELKPLTAAQLNAAVELDQLCFGGLWTRSGYERELESPNSQLLVLEAQSASNEQARGSNACAVSTQYSVTSEIETTPNMPNSLVGLGCYWSILEEAHITILAVHPNYQGQGIGQLLLHTLLQEAKEHKLEWATLEVKPSNQVALSLYRKFGFTEAGRRRRYYKDTGEDALILWRKGLQDLEFEKILSDCYRQIIPRLSEWGWQLSDARQAERIDYL
ncbi:MULTISPECIES: ribosomal protein S18-alanine N-acetyltransferase [unclassified Coleofasciculus]|uniref:ribosomal protein S18-alanine N-acetyltransferase n=1 Tax=unclassified Coleofasciculus TaxID=2692782 RepID=UPI001882E0AD|nr:MULTISPECIES: ribosomal protein S18-alanine N-acetyltransferase [unclassified Coleofasciculus]MBE9127084.1 ribosomal protein S18-alanine N-acetyltransferase [Coleofasciculus sp. LEGE 07081]MBE9150472.1 ribosomal protein S18-alanine N-acetyltransferase [Coleofasciculus sp. LEGE 07092]